MSTQRGHIPPLYRIVFFNRQREKLIYSNSVHTFMKYYRVLVIRYKSCCFQLFHEAVRNFQYDWWKDFIYNCYVITIATSVIIITNLEHFLIIVHIVLIQWILDKSLFPLVLGFCVEQVRMFLLKDFLDLKWWPPSS